MKKISFIFLLTCFLFGNVPLSFSQVMTIAIGGHITLVDDLNDFLNGGILVGDSITGEIAYDLSATDGNPSPSIGDYSYTSLPSGIKLYTGNYSFMSDPTDVSFLVEVVNDATDELLFDSYLNSFPQITYDFLSKEISWQLSDITGAAVTNTELPEEIILANWKQPDGLIIKGETDTDYPFMIQALITKATVSKPSSINEDFSKTSFFVYPNPSTSFVNIKQGNSNEDFKVTISNAIGEEVIASNGKGKLSVDLSNEESGIYLLKVESSRETLITKIMKR